ncbi:MAG TPA: menaquinone biosynthesis protein [Pyrinomonadaceae bacterium]|nr:menaquinone biosynthesis protein [Pyrinomonadaceae bacterium]
MSARGRAEGAPRIAASSYLNTAPLIWSFTRGDRRREVRLLTDTAPARCADLLARGEVEASLVPMIEYQRIPEIAVVPGVCVGTRSRVRSVVIATRGAELKDVRTVALDTSSRTSVALVHIIFREFLGFEPEWRPCAPDLRAMLETNDAALMIGDPAMIFPREELRVFDLASLWRGLTGLGFVFAMWMMHESAAERVRAADFAGARDEGLEHVEEIINDYESSLGLPRSELRAYLLEDISFDLDAEMRAGLDLYYTLAHKHGIIPAVRPLKMIRT